jgi:hypothetical protein
MAKNLREERIGEINTNKQGCSMKIIEYNKAIDIFVEFQDDYRSIVHTAYSAFSKGKVRNPNRRLGETSINNQGCEMVIVEYNNCDDIYVEFNDKYKYRAHAQYHDFIEGGVKNLYHPNVCGMGFLGDGKHISSENNKNTKKYDTWSNMLHRVYNKDIRKKLPSYEDCQVCKEWHNFQNFGNWFDENYYIIGASDNMALDKDILVKNNKKYSPDTCVFVPKSINSLFTRRESSRGDTPIGVYYREDNNKYRALCCNQLIGDKPKQIKLGQFDNQRQAFLTYKQYKEKHIKEVADYYKSKIPESLYDALYDYKVDITD